MLQIADAVKMLHDNMWVHRDIKSGNVLISNEDDLKICDLGEAVRHSEKKPFKGNLFCGTAAYLAPELMPESSFTKIDDFKTDIYSLGVFFWEILEGGEYPYKEHFEKTGVRLFSGRSGLPPRFSQQYQLSDVFQGPDPTWTESDPGRKQGPRGFVEL